MGAIRWEGPGQLEAVNKITFDEHTELFQLHLAPEYQDWLTWEQDGVFLYAPPVSWSIPLLGISKYERNADDLMWSVFNLRVDLKKEFNP